MITENVEKQCAEVLKRAFRRGLRRTNLGDQPAPWVTAGLQKLEAGKPISDVDISQANKTQTFILRKV